MKKMRLATATLLIAAVTACSDRAENPVQPTSTTADAKGPTTGPIQDIIDLLFPQPGLHQAASAKLATIKKHLEKGNIADAQQEAVSLSEYTTFHLNDGALLDPNGERTTSEAVAELNCALHNYVTPGTDDDIANCVTFGEQTGDVLDNGGAVGIIGPAGGVLVTPEGREGISVPSGATLIPRVFTIDPIAATIPRDGPLVQPPCVAGSETNNDCLNVDEYPLFAHFTVDPAEPLGVPDFLIPVTIGLCHLDPNDGPFAPPSEAVEQRLRIAHNLELVQSTILEVLTKTDAPFLDCATFNSSELIVEPVELNAIGGALRTLASAARPLLMSLLPEAAHAAMASCCLGGLATKLSPFGAVDPGVLLPAQDPAGEANLESGVGESTAILFNNRTDETVLIYWINEQGQRVSYGQLAAGHSYIQQTFVTHPWVITNLNNEGLAIYHPVAGLGHAEFTGPVGQGPYPPPPPPVEECVLCVQ